VAEPTLEDYRWLVSEPAERCLAEAAVDDISLVRQTHVPMMLILILFSLSLSLSRSLSYLRAWLEKRPPKFGAV